MRKRLLRNAEGRRECEGSMQTKCPRERHGSTERTENTRERSLGREVERVTVRSGKRRKRRNWASDQGIRLRFDERQHGLQRGRRG